MNSDGEKDAEKKVESFQKDAGKELKSAVDKFDKSVTEVSDTGLESVCEA